MISFNKNVPNPNNQRHWTNIGKHELKHFNGHFAYPFEAFHNWDQKKSQLFIPSILHF